ncbi:hydrogenase large subunit [Sabulicella rubraurantiaca]|uniref:hydrogenase large subunit n=1 Tax=Sabulicella rubraurantiaca TaxID=2811429 RepID=UPI001A97A7C7|nr:NADH-quinone oxidoreductase subunit C [Sabulicella rubraurantiaca]
MSDWSSFEGYDFLALWAEPGRVHAAFLDPETPAVQTATLPAETGQYPALSPRFPAAAWFERSIRDLWGLEAEGAADLRPWLDHGLWPIRAPLSRSASRHSPVQELPEFLPVEGEGIHRIPVGPIHAGVIEAGHFRFHVQGETIVRLEARLGYKHKGVLALMLGKSPRAAMRFAARLSGDTTVAHSIAFARAAESASGAELPPRAVALRAAMLELERLHNHLNDMGFLAKDAAFTPLSAQFGLLREALLRVLAQCFGHRLMMDRIIPGGVALDPEDASLDRLRTVLAEIGRELPGLLAIYEGHASLQDRMMGTGIIPPALVAAFAPGGVVGRSAGRPFDARLLDGPITVPLRTGGDVDARWRQRHDEALHSLALLDAILSALPSGPVTIPLPQRGGEAVALAEGFRGECLAWLRLDDGGLIEAAFLRDPSWLHWPLLEAAVIGNIVADFPLINKSFNGSYSGCDL